LAVIGLWMALVITYVRTTIMKRWARKIYPQNSSMPPSMRM